MAWKKTKIINGWFSYPKKSKTLFVWVTKEVDMFRIPTHQVLVEKYGTNEWGVSTRINRREKLLSDYRLPKARALAFAKSWMRKHPRG